MVKTSETMKEKKTFESNVGYNRVAIKKGTGVSDSKVSYPSSASIRDKLMCFLTGETEDTRVARVRLNAYLKSLEIEHQRVGVARSQHYDGGKKLFDDFERQKLQLHKWGLLSILPAFQMQAWLRVSRAELVVEMSFEALVVIESKIKHTEYAIAQFASNNKTTTSNSSKADEKLVLFVTDSQPELAKICQPIAEVVENDANFSSLSGMLTQMDVVCNASLRTFQSLLPEVQSRTYAQRRLALLEILHRYSQWYLTEEPSTEVSQAELIDRQSSTASIEDRKGVDNTGGSRESSVAQKLDDLSLAWDSYSAWYSERRSAMYEIEKEFSYLIEDEREKEGRLLRKWCSLSLSAAPSKGAERSSSSSSAKRSEATKRDVGRQDISSGKVGHTDTSTKVEGDRLQDSRRLPSSDTPDAELTMKMQARRSQSHALRLPSERVPADSSRRGLDVSTPASLHSPRCVTAFVDYFCSYYVAGPYGLGSSQLLEDALKALVECVVFRRLNNRVFRYPSADMKENDAKWRAKCEFCSLVDHRLFGIVPRYIEGEDRDTGLDSINVGGCTWKDVRIFTNREVVVSAVCSVGAETETLGARSDALDLLGESKSAEQGAASAAVPHTSVDLRSHVICPEEGPLDNDVSILSEASFAPRGLTVVQSDLEGRGPSPSLYKSISVTAFDFFDLEEGGLSGGCDKGRSPELCQSEDSSIFETEFKDSHNADFKGSPLLRAHTALGIDFDDQPYGDDDKNDDAGSRARSLLMLKMSCEGDCLARFSGPPSASSGAEEEGSVIDYERRHSGLKREDSVFEKGEDAVSTLDELLSLPLEWEEARTRPCAFSKPASSYSESPSVLPFFSSLLSPPSLFNFSTSASSNSSTIDFNNLGDSTDSFERDIGSVSAEDLQLGIEGAGARHMSDNSLWLDQSGERDRSLECRAGKRLTKLNPDVLLINPSDEGSVRSAASRSSSATYTKSVREITDSYNSSNLKDNTCLDPTPSSTKDPTPSGKKAGAVSAAYCGASKRHLLINLLEDRQTALPAPAPSPHSALASTVEGQEKGAELNGLPGHNSAVLFRKHYRHSIRLLGLLACSVTPTDIVFHLLAAVKWLLKEAGAVSGKSEYLGADLLFPLLVGVLVHSKIPHTHLILHFMANYGHPDQLGESAYYMTCLQAAVEFVLELQMIETVPNTPPEPLLDRVDSGSGPRMCVDLDAAHEEQSEIDSGTPPLSSPSPHVGGTDPFSGTAQSLSNPEDTHSDYGDREGEGKCKTESAKRSDSALGYEAVVKLGEWLREHEATEEALSLLQQEGWMR